MKSQVIQSPFAWLQKLQTIPNLALLSTLAILSLAIISLCSNNKQLFHPSQYKTGERLDKRCDISRGQWIRDEDGAQYTNATCYTIQEHQNCVKYGRPDMDFLKWRWKPEGCELPRFDPAWFLEVTRGKELAFVGDSLARNQMQSLMLSKVT